MKRKTLYIDFEDILELIESCNEKEMDKIKSIINGGKKDFSESQIQIQNLYDLQKAKLLKAASEKFTLEQLMEKLGMNHIDY